MLSGRCWFICHSLAWYRAIGRSKNPEGQVSSNIVGITFSPSWDRVKRSTKIWGCYDTPGTPGSDRPVIFAVLRTVFFSPSPRGVTQISFNPPPSTALGGFIFNSGWTLLEIRAFSLLLFLNYKISVFCFPGISIFNFENQICKLNMITWEKW